MITRVLPTPPLVLEVLARWLKEHGSLRFFLESHNAYMAVTYLLRRVIAAEHVQGANSPREGEPHDPHPTLRTST
ncbi:MAG: hypothetical protein SPJ13_03355 [Bacteroidales bacterium]|nr:hypothetical protein [Bacteroidales bacterium]